MAVARWKPVACLVMAIPLYLSVSHAEAKRAEPAWTLALRAVVPHVR